MAIRYVKQRDETSCGPVVLINALKWLGCGVTYDGFIGFSRDLCRWVDGRTGDGGTYDNDLHRAIKALGIKNKRITKPTIKQIDDHISNGGAVILGYFRPYTIKFWAAKNDPHYTLCIDMNDNNYTFVNEANKTIKKLSREVVKKMIRNKVGSENSIAWLISK